MHVNFQQHWKNNYSVSSEGKGIFCLPKMAPLTSQCMHMHSGTQSGLTTDSSLPGSSAHGILPARILEGVASSYSMGSSCPRHQIHISRVSRIGSWIPYQWVTWEPNMSVLKSILGSEGYEFEFSELCFLWHSREIMWLVIKFSLFHWLSENNIF